MITEDIHIDDVPEFRAIHIFADDPRNELADECRQTDEIARRELGKYAEPREWTW